MANYGKKIEVAFNAALPGILRDLTRSSAVLNRKAQAVADEVVEIVRERTLSGIDVRGRAFAPYTKQYAAFKKAALGGKKTSRLIGKTGWLRASGRMLSSMIARNVRVVPKSTGLSLFMTLTFADSERAQIAEYHDKLGAGKSKVKRPFLGLSTSPSLRRKELNRLLQTWRRA